MIGALSIGCGRPALSSATVAAVSAHPHAAELWSDKCGSCHVPVEPGTRSRGVIEAAMRRHRARAHLGAGEWAELADFLSPAGSVATTTAGPEPRTRDASR